VTCPETGETFFTDARGVNASLKDKKNKFTNELERDGNGFPLKAPEKSTFACRADGKKNDVLKSIKASGKTGPMAGYAIQGYAPQLDEKGAAYKGRFFAPFDTQLATQYDASLKEWETRKEGDLSPYWPRSDQSFQIAYSGELALIFWLPEGKRRFHINPATDAVTWRCAAPHSAESIDFGRVLWGQAHEYPQEILLAGNEASAGLFHRHIS
jgi:hypothetical protein